MGRSWDEFITYRYRGAEKGSYGNLILGMIYYIIEEFRLL